MSDKNILITGGTGLIGSAVSELLYQKGYSVRHLSRIENLSVKFPKFKWSVQHNYIDPRALENINFVIHLAGENISSGRWTTKRKQRIYNSRVQGTRMLVNELNNTKLSTLKHVIFASSIGYYGDRDNTILTPESSPGDNFLAKVTRDWELEMSELKKCGFTIIRAGTVLSRKGGALPKLTLPFAFGFGVIPGSGNQWISSIWIDEIASLYLSLIENFEDSKTIINGVDNNPKQFKDFLPDLASQLNRKLIFIHFPKLFFKMLYGEMSDVILNSQRVVRI